MRLNTFFIIIIVAILLVGGYFTYDFLSLKNKSKDAFIFHQDGNNVGQEGSTNANIKNNSNIIDVPKIEVLDSQVTLYWSPLPNATENQLYHIISNGVDIGSTPYLKYAVINLEPLKTYPFIVEAVDNSGKVMAQSSELNVTTKSTQEVASSKDKEAPKQITDLSSSNLKPNSADLSWTSPSDSPSGGSVAFYDIRYSTNEITSDSWISSTPISGEIKPLSPGSKQKYILDGLSQGQKYFVAIRSMDLAGNTSDISNVVSFGTQGNLSTSGYVEEDTIAPTVPKNLVATAASSKQVNLSWLASTDAIGVSGYNINRCIGAKCTTVTKIATSNKKLYFNIGLTPSTIYRYSVSAYDAAGNVSANSSIAQATTKAVSAVDNTAPTIPTGLVATATSPNQINIYWNASTDSVGVSGYRINRCNSSGCTPTSQIATPSSRSYSDTGLIASTTYRYSVSAYDAAGNISGSSSVSQATTVAASVPDVVTPPIVNFNSTCGSGGSCTAADIAPHNTRGNCWVYLYGPFTSKFTSNKAYNITSYVANGSNHPGGDIIVPYCGQNIYDYFILGNGNGWSHTSSAINTVLQAYYIGPFSSSSVPLTPTLDTVAPTTPSGLTATAFSSSQINLSWNASADAVGVTGYKIYKNGTQITTTSNTSYSSTGLSSATLYTYYVVAYDTAGNNSNSSSTAQATTQSLTSTQTCGTGGSCTAADIAPHNTRGNCWVYLSGPFTSNFTSNKAYNITSYVANGSSGHPGGDIIVPYCGQNIYDYFILGNGNGWSHSSSAINTVLQAYYIGPFTGSSNNNNNASDTTAPTAPTGLIAKVISSSQIDLSWNASTDATGVTGYKIYQNGIQIDIATSTSYSDTGLTNNTSYTYKIVAYDDAGNNSNYSSSAQVTTQDNSDTISPTVSLAAPADGSTVSGSSVVVSANATDNVGVAGVQFKLDGSDINAEDTVSPYSIIWNSVIFPDGYHLLTALARDAAGNTTVSLSRTINILNNIVTSDTTAPSVPTSFVASAVLSTQINLTWTASTDAVGVTGYNINRCNGSGCTPIANVFNTSNHSYSDTGLAASTLYRYSISAYDAAGNTSSNSSISQTTTLAASVSDTTAPTVPSGLVATAISSSQINLTWTASTDAVGITGYNIKRCSGASCTPTQFITTTSNSYSNTGLIASTLYRYSISAYDAAGNTSSNSSISQATTSAVVVSDTTPPVLSGGSPSGSQASGTTQVTLSVTTNENATCKYSSASGTTYSSMSNTFSTTGGTSHSTVVTGLTNGTSYNRYVRCQDVAGNSNTSDYTISFSVAVAPASTCGTGGTCSASDIAPHNTRVNCWVYMSGTFTTKFTANKAYNITSYVTNGSTHPGGDVIVSHCGGNLYSYVVGTSGGHAHSSSAINTILQAYYIGPFQ
ncbi:MAG: fibronectin type III domain-containing protein [Candidatus Nomurabacteria bacterium]